MPLLTCRASSGAILSSWHLTSPSPIVQTWQSESTSSARTHARVCAIAHCWYTAVQASPRKKIKTPTNISPAMQQASFISSWFLFCTKGGPGPAGESFNRNLFTSPTPTPLCSLPALRLPRTFYLSSTEIRPERLRAPILHGQHAITLGKQCPAGLQSFSVMQTNLIRIKAIRRPDFLYRIEKWRMWHWWCPKT